MVGLNSKSMAEHRNPALKSGVSYSFPAHRSHQKYVLRLYITGTTPRSMRAIANIKNICENYLKGRYQLEVIDIYENPSLGKGEQIIASPTLIKKLPLPLHRFIGDLSNTERILLRLDLQPGHYSDNKTKEVARYNKTLPAQPIEKRMAEIALPEFKDSPEAIAFGRQNAGKPDIMAALEQRIQKASTGFKSLMTEKKHSEAVRVAFRGQLANEALDFAQSPKQQTPIERLQAEQREAEKNAWKAGSPRTTVKGLSYRGFREPAKRGKDWVFWG